MITSAPLRLPRTLVLAAGATAIGAVSHRWSGGTLDAAEAVYALPVLAALAWPLTGRERGWLAILGVQLGAQQAAHVIFGLRATGGGADAGPHDPARPVDAWFYAHVAAAVVVATWLRYAERRTWAAARRATAALTTYWRRLLVLFERPGAGHPEPTPVQLDAVTLRPFPPLHHCVIRRGPPLPA